MFFKPLLGEMHEESSAGYFSTDLVSAEERPRLTKANLTHGVFQVGVDLNLKEDAQLKTLKL